MNTSDFNPTPEGTTYTATDVPLSPSESAKEARRIFSGTFLPLVIFFVVCYSAVFLAGILVPIFFPSTYEKIISDPVFQMLLNVVAMYILAFPVFLLLSRFLGRNKQKTIAEKKKISLAEFFVFLLMGQGCMFAGGIVGNLINGFIGEFFGGFVDNDVSNLISETPILLTFAVVVIIGPIIEELMFRKVLIDKLSVFGDFYAILFSAAAFGFFHGNLYQFFYAALIGMVLGYVYTKTHRVSYTIAIHMIINFFGSIVPIFFSYISEFIYDFSLNEAQGIIGEEFYMSFLFLFGSIYSTLNYAISLSGIGLIVYYIIKNKFSFKKGELDFSASKTLEYGIINVGSIIYLCICFIMIMMNSIPTQI